MKKIGILVFAALMMVGLAACEKQAGGDAAAGDGTGTTAGATTGETGATTTPPTKDAATATPTSTLPLTTVEFFEETHNFGEIKQNEKVRHTFRFKNTGANPLKVENVKPSCGCTTPDWTKDEIAPGAEGMIEVEFDSKGKQGVIRKTVSVVANTDPRNKILSFTGEVLVVE